MLKKIKKALISVSDKSDLKKVLNALKENNIVKLKDLVLIVQKFQNIRNLMKC